MPRGACAIIGILHTTESAPGTFPALVRFFERNPGVQPHLLVDPETQQLQKFVPVGEPAKALRNLTGGVETNRRDADGEFGPDLYQVEIVGCAADVGGYSDEWYRWLAEQLYAISAFLHIDYVFRPADAGRFTPEEWYDPNLRGWIGHRHVPENDHTDPGTLDLGRLAAYMPTTAPEEAETMNLSDPIKLRDYQPEDAAYLGADHDVPSTVEGALIFGHAEARQANLRAQLLQADIASLKNTVSALITTVNATTSAATRPATIDYDLLAGKVADVLAARLRA